MPRPGICTDHRRLLMLSTSVEGPDMRVGRLARADGSTSAPSIPCADCGPQPTSPQTTDALTNPPLPRQQRDSAPRNLGGGFCAAKFAQRCMALLPERETRSLEMSRVFSACLVWPLVISRTRLHVGSSVGHSGSCWFDFMRISLKPFHADLAPFMDSCRFGSISYKYPLPILLDSQSISPQLHLSPQSL